MSKRNGGYGVQNRLRLSIRISDSLFVGCCGGLIYIVIMILCGCKRIFIISAVYATKGERRYKPWHMLPFLLRRFFYRVHSTSRRIIWYKSVKLPSLELPVHRSFKSFQSVVKITKNISFKHLSYHHPISFQINMFHFIWNQLDRDLTSGLLFCIVIFNFFSSFCSFF